MWLVLPIECNLDQFCEIWSQSLQCMLNCKFLCVHMYQLVVVLHLGALF